ncbi:hypothetical protein ACS3UN_07740 [Oscillospiraceae bacterium LTW-04]|nr:hypothetical protein RBH76_02600 [Oscillospiraceae bacterium MB24-C1]
MYKQPNKRKVINFYSNKSEKWLPVFDDLSERYAIKLEADSTITEFETNVQLNSWSSEIDMTNISVATSCVFCSDFLIRCANGKSAIREVATRSRLGRSDFLEYLEISRRFWQAKGYTDWGVISSLEGK